MLWGLMLLPILLLFVGVLISTAFYDRYMDRISSKWEGFALVDVSKISRESLMSVIRSRIGPDVLDEQEAASMAETLDRWVKSQDSGTGEAFRSFRGEGVKGGDVIVSEALGYYYAQFLNGYQCGDSGEALFNDRRGPDVVDVLFEAHADRHELSLNGKRLCLSCVRGVSLESIEIEVKDRDVLPLNEFMNGEDRLSLESFTGVFEAVGEFRHYLTGLVSRSKTANVSFVVSSGEGNRKAYKCGMQLLWLPKRKTWFPIELMIGYPGDRMPMEAFLF